MSLRVRASTKNALSSWGLSFVWLSMSWTKWMRGSVLCLFVRASSAHEIGSHVTLWIEDPISRKTTQITREIREEVQ